MSLEEARGLATAAEVRRRVEDAKRRRHEEQEQRDSEREGEKAILEETHRRSFNPCAQVLAERRPGTVIGAWSHSRRSVIHSEEGTDPEAFAERALRALPKKTPLGGKTLGYVGHYSADHTIRYDLSGKRVLESDAAMPVDSKTDC